MFELNAKVIADLLLYLLSHFEHDGHTVHMLTQWHLQTLTNRVKLSLFMHAHSSPLSLAAQLHRCHTYYSHYINNGWTFSRHTSYINSICSCKIMHTLNICSRPATISFRMDNSLNSLFLCGLSLFGHSLQQKIQVADRQHQK